MGKFNMTKCEKLVEKAEKKRKACEGGESENSTCSVVQLKTRRLEAEENSEENSTCESVNSDHVLASCSSSNGSSELAKESLKIADLEEEEEEENKVNVELMATSAGDSVDFRDRRRETTPLREVQAAEPGELESTAMPPTRASNSRRRSTAGKMPSDAELEEFFAVAEQNLQKQFIDKYNYDIVKDEPLEGRYEWVEIQLKP